MVESEIALLGESIGNRGEPRGCMFRTVTQARLGWANRANRCLRGQA